MSALPQGAFAALKIRQSISEDKKFGNDSFKAERQTTVYPPVNNKCKFYNIHCFMSSIPVMNFHFVQDNLSENKTCFILEVPKLMPKL